MSSSRFSGDTISCCAVSREFGIAVCGTVSGSIVVYSLFNGTKVNVIRLGGFRPVKVLVTTAWGFIVTYASMSMTGKTVNRRLIRVI
jgi:hypothetical protein